MCASRAPDHHRVGRGRLAPFHFPLDRFLPSGSPPPRLSSSHSSTPADWPPGVQLVLVVGSSSPSSRFGILVHSFVAWRRQQWRLRRVRFRSSSASCFCCREIRRRPATPSPPVGRSPAGRASCPSVASSGSASSSQVPDLYIFPNTACSYGFLLSFGVQLR